MKKFLSILIAGFFMISTVSFPITSSAKGVAATASDLTLEAKTQLKAELLNHLADMYNKILGLTKSEIHAIYLDELFAQEKKILETVATVEDTVLQSEIMSTVSNRVTEVKENIQSLSKEQILENILIAQEELSHLGVEQVAKGVLALLASIALVPIFLAGVVIAGAGILCLPVDILTFGLFPLGTAIFMVGTFIAAGSFAGAAVVWTWASM